MKTLTKDMRATISPIRVPELIKAGNQRFLKNLKINHNLLYQANESSNGQHPFTGIISPTHAKFVQIVAKNTIKRIFKVVVERCDIAESHLLDQHTLNFTH